MQRYIASRATMRTQNEIIKALADLDTSLGAWFYYKLQCTHPYQSGWFDWMPDNAVKKFSFEEDAIKEAKRLAEGSVPFSGISWRVIFVATTSEVLDVAT